MHTQYCIENKRLDLYLSEYKVGIEIDEYDYAQRDPEYEMERQKLIKDYRIMILRTNPDAPEFNINRLIKQI